MKQKLTIRLNQVRNRFGLLLVAYLLMRGVFLALNTHHYSKFSSSELASAFFMGLRFDLSAIILINSPLIILALLPKIFIQQNVYNRVTHWLFILLNTPFILANLVDVEYFKFTGRRLTIDVFAFHKEAANQTNQFIINFWHIALIAIFIVAGLFYFSRKLHIIDGAVAKLNLNNFIRHLAILFVILVVCVFGIRGGFQKKVLNTAHAYLLGHAELGTLALNSSFTLIQSYKKKNVMPVSFFKTTEQAAEVLLKPKLSLRKGPEKINVVLIVLESFATEFWGAANTYQGYTPFLDSLAKKGSFFKNNFANGRRSMEAMTSILFNTPALMATPIAVSSYQQNTWVGLGKILNANNYHTSFFHGAPKGTMYFDAISSMAGLNDYYPLERYPHKGDFDKNWGLYDEPFLQYMIKELKNKPQPFFSMVFTISTHQPYHVPDQYVGHFRKGPLKIHESVGYVDNAMKLFFAAAEKEPWFKNTLFVITGDHTQMSASETYNTSLGGFMVPLLLYHPDKKLPIQDIDMVTQHTDISASILDYVGIHDAELTLFGRSVFADNNKGEAILYLDQNYWLVQKDYFLRYIPAQDKASMYKYSDKEELEPLTENSEAFNLLKLKTQAYIQYYQNSLIDNNIYFWQQAKK